MPEPTRAEAGASIRSRGRSSFVLSAAAGDQAARATARRLVSVFPAGDYALTTLLELFDIVLTDAVETAAVECQVRPRLLLNPGFLEAHCRTDEALLMLVLHELHHVILGHTRLFPRVDATHNLAFDAVINAMLARRFPEPRYLALFRALYRADLAPECLLRPPLGWPGPFTIPVELSPTMRGLVAALYGHGAGPTYEELYAAIREVLGAEVRAEGEGDGTAARRVVLLGDHACDDPSAPAGSESERGRGDAAARDPLLVAALREVVARWPPPPQARGGRSADGLLHRRLLAPGRPPPSLRAVIARALCWLLPPRAGSRGARRGALGPLPIETPLPTLRDRRACARAGLGAAPLLFASEVAARPTLAAAGAVAVYLDVSGSLDPVRPTLLAALGPLVQRGEVALFAFSTVVRALDARSIAARAIETTEGTDIRCVTEHLLARPRIRRALIVTDGEVGAVPKPHAERLRARRTRLACVLTSDGDREDLAPIVARFFPLPDLSPPLTNPSTSHGR